MALKLLLLALAGGLGTVCRYGCAVLVQRWADGPFPWHTLAINCAGCLLFGLVFSLGEVRAWWAGDVRVLVLVGFMGAFTTFSTFGFETAALMRESQYSLAMMNALAQNALGVAFVFAGIGAGRWLGG